MKRTSKPWIYPISLIVISLLFRVIVYKVDLPSAMVYDVKQQIIELIGCEENEIIEASAKSGIGIDKIFDAIINKILTKSII